MDSSYPTTRQSLLVLALIAASCPLAGQSSPLVCNAVAGVSPISRAEGLSELAGDVIVNCTGSSQTRTLRLTNLRANASQIGAPSSSFIANVSANGNTSLTINNPQQTVANIL
jgi:hypothetical protein